MVLMALDPSHSSLEGKFVDHMEDALENVVVSFKEIVDGGMLSGNAYQDGPVEGPNGASIPDHRPCIQSYV